MNETARILCAISAEKPTTLGVLLESLKPDCPPWHLLFHTLVALESQELVKIRRENNIMRTLQLTPLGSERAREAMEGETHYCGCCGRACSGEWCSDCNDHVDKRKILSEATYLAQFEIDCPYSIVKAEAVEELGL